MNFHPVLCAIATSTLFTGAALAVPAISAPAEPASQRAPGDIIDVAVQAGSFKTLAAALQAAGLVDVLRGSGPFTVFAPTDDAFAKLPAGTVEHLLKPENRAALISVLTYHVVPGRVTAADVMKLDRATTVQGQRVAIAVKGGKVTVGNATVTAADVRASNGVIHVIDQVILPSMNSIVDVASEAGSFSTLLAAATHAGLAETLGSDGPFTVFAPTDAAFAALPAGTVDSLLRPENRQKLIDILKLHVVPGRVYADQALSAGRADALLKGQPLRFKLSEGRLTVNGIRVINNDIDASNGVIHVIDRVILPSS